MTFCLEYDKHCSVSTENPSIETKDFLGLSLIPIALLWSSVVFLVVKSVLGLIYIEWLDVLMLYILVGFVAWPFIAIVMVVIFSRLRLLYSTASKVITFLAWVISQPIPYFAGKLLGL